MLQYLTAPGIETGADFLELGLMAAASPEFAELFARRLAACAEESGKMAAPTTHWVDAAGDDGQLSSR